MIRAGEGIIFLSLLVSPFPACRLVAGALNGSEGGRVGIAKDGLSLLFRLSLLRCCYGMGICEVLERKIFSSPFINRCSAARVLLSFCSCSPLLFVGEDLDAFA